MLSTDRLIIRPFSAQDGPALFDYLSKPEIYRYEPGEPVTQDTAQKMAEERSKSDHFHAVALKESNLLIGHLYFEQIDPMHLITWELGYIFNPAYQRKGYASESALALIRHGFDTLHIHRVVAHCNPENIASWRVMEKIGMRREGFFRKNIYFHINPDGSPRWLDTYEYAILQDDLIP